MFQKDFLGTLLYITLEEISSSRRLESSSLSSAKAEIPKISSESLEDSLIRGSEVSSQIYIEIFSESNGLIELWDIRSDPLSRQKSAELDEPKIRQMVNSASVRIGSSREPGCLVSLKQSSSGLKVWKSSIKPQKCHVLSTTVHSIRFTILLEYCNLPKRKLSFVDTDYLYEETIGVKPLSFYFEETQDMTSENSDEVSEEELEVSDEIVQFKVLCSRANKSPLFCGDELSVLDLYAIQEEWNYLKH